MAYIGKNPVVGNFVKLDAITTSSTATYNLTNGGVAYYPQSANNCIVSLNGVIQSPTSAYTISGSTIVFSDALTASDTIDFILVLGDVLNIGTPSDNTVSLAKLTATGTKNSTTFLRGDNTFAVPAGGTNTPSFFAYRTSDQTPSSSTVTKFQVNTELYDTDSCYDNATNYRFTPTTSGKYFVFAHFLANTTGTNSTNSKVFLRKNGSDVYTETSEFVQLPSAIIGQTISTILDMNGSSDYVESFVYSSASAPAITGYFGAYKLIGV